MTEKNLTEESARPLNSREIAKIISAVLGGFVSWCDPEEIMAAIDHIHANREGYRTHIKTMAYLGLKSPKTSQADQLSKEKTIGFILLTLCTMTEKTDPEILADLVTLIASNPVELSNLLSIASEKGASEITQRQVQNLTDILIRQS